MAQLGKENLYKQKDMMKSEKIKEINLLRYLTKALCLSSAMAREVWWYCGSSPVSSHIGQQNKGET